MEQKGFSSVSKGSESKKDILSEKEREKPADRQRKLTTEVNAGNKGILSKIKLTQKTHTPKCIRNQLEKLQMK